MGMGVWVIRASQGARGQSPCCCDHQRSTAAQRARKGQAHSEIHAMGIVGKYKLPASPHLY